MPNPPPPSDDSAAFPLGGWDVEPAACRLSQGARRIVLEPKVMQLLVHLAAHEGAVVERGALLEALWGRVHVVDGVLARAAYQLRKRLDSGGAAAIRIETLRQRGYRLVTVETGPSVRKVVRIGAIARTPLAGWAVAAILALLAIDMRMPAAVPPPSIAIARQEPAALGAQDGVTRVRPSPVRQPSRFRQRAAPATPQPSDPEVALPERVANTPAPLAPGVAPRAPGDTETPVARTDDRPPAMPEAWAPKPPA